MREILKVSRVQELRSTKVAGNPDPQNVRNIVLQELGGKQENEYAVTLWGDSALKEWTPGSLVYAVLRFQTKENKGQIYQSVTASCIINLNVYSHV